MTDRLAIGYEPRFDHDAAFGHQAEMWTANIVHALESGSAEVKHDAIAARTGNVYVEYECKRRGRYVPSGIQTSIADVWVFVLCNTSLCVVVATETLRSAARGGGHRRAECVRGSHPTRGVLVPIAWLLANAGKFSTLERNSS